MAAEQKTIDYSKPLENSKYERFCQEYTVDNNKSQAAIRAGYSENRADSRGAHLWGIDSIRGRVEYLQGELSKASGLDAKMLMEESKKIGFANIKGIVGSGNRIEDISGLSDEVTAAISSVANTRAGVKITMHSKETALENMGKHIGFYGKDNEQRGAILYNPELK